MSLSCGFWHIRESNRLVSEFFPEYRPTGRTAPLLVYNHVSFLDVIYLIHSQHSPSFISKIDVKKLPLVGVICTGSQGVYVSRDNQDNRSEALDAISKRVELAQ